MAHVITEKTVSPASRDRTVRLRVCILTIKFVGDTEIICFGITEKQ